MYEHSVLQGHIRPVTLHRRSIIMKAFSLIEMKSDITLPSQNTLVHESGSNGAVGPRGLAKTLSRANY